MARGIDYLIGEHVDLIACWMFKHMPYYQTLRKLRFIEWPSDLHFGARIYSAEHEPAFWMDPEKWYLSMGDSDIF